MPDSINSPNYPSWQTYPTSGGSPHAYPGTANANSIQVKLYDEDVGSNSPASSINQAFVATVESGTGGQSLAMFKSLVINPTRATRNIQAHGE